jgi:hypothetical protein
MAQNLIYNPSFEVDLANTSIEDNLGGGVTITRTSAEANNGTYSCAFYIPSSAQTDNWRAKIRFNSTNNATVENGKRYVVSAYVKASASHGEFRGEFTGAGSYYPGNKSLTTSWARYDWAFTASQDGNLEVRFLANNGNEITIWIDGLMMEQLDAGGPSTYFDGDTSGYEWTGTAHNSISQTASAPASQTRLKTVEYAMPMLTSVAHSTLTNFDQITIYLPETGTKTFKSVELRVTAMDVNTSTTAVNWTARRIDYRLGSASYVSVNNTNAVTQCGENTCILLHRDMTAHFVSNWTGTSMTFDAAVLFSMATAYAFSNVTARLYITYEYDDSSTTQIKTVYIPLNGPVNALETSRPTTALDTIPNLDTYLPEASKTYRDMFIWFGANTNNTAATATTDTIVSHQIDAATAYTTGTHEAAMASDIWVEHIFKPTFTTNATHEYRAWVSTGGVARCHCPQIYLVVTYEYNDSTTTSVMNSMLLPMEWDSPSGGTAATDFQRANRDLWIEEPATITLQRLALYVNAEQPISVAANVRFRVGTGDWVQYTSAAATVGGQVGWMVRNDSAFTFSRGKNVLQADSYSGSANVTPTNISSMWIVNYTSGKHSSGTGAHNHTVFNVVKSHGTGAALLRQLSSAVPFIQIPETNYFINGAGLVFEWITTGTINPTGVIIQVEKLSSEGGHEWVSAYVDVNACDPEIGIHTNYAQTRSIFQRWNGDTDASRLSLSANRRFYTIVPNIVLTGASVFHERLTSMVTYHTITYNVSGTVTGSNGGTVTIDLHRTSDGQKLKTTSRTGNGAYSFVWYDNTAAVYAVARETDTYVGRSGNGNAS